MPCYVALTITQCLIFSDHISFTVTEPHLFWKVHVFQSQIYPFLAFLRTTYFALHNIHMLHLQNAWMCFEYLCTSIEQICFVFDWQVNCQGSVRGFLGEFNNNFELSPKKRKIVKEHIYKQKIYRSLMNSHKCVFRGSYTCTKVTPLQ